MATLAPAKLLVSLGLLLAAAPAAGQFSGAGALLDPEQAFRISGRALDCRTVYVPREQMVRVRLP